MAKKVQPKKLKTKQDLKKLQEKLKSGKMKVEIASQSVVNQHPEILEKFLKIIGHPEALVTDFSSLSDFGDLWLPGIRLETLRIFKVDIKPVMNKDFSEIFAYIAAKPKPQITLKALADQLGLKLVK